uniref:Uncharacterized protein n=1 Tax=Arundo donax TaxID=35708 RepID=A0A0A9H0Y3_ARUDO
MTWQIKFREILNELVLTRNNLSSFTIARWRQQGGFDPNGEIWLGRYRRS